MEENTRKRQNTVSIKATDKLIIPKKQTKSQVQISLIEQKEELIQRIIDEQQLFKIQGEKLKDILHRSIGALTWLNKDKKFVVGSGVIISKNIVLTCAHNLFDLKNRVQFQKETFKFYFQNNGVGRNYYEVQDFRYPQQFKRSPSQTEFDFALIKLSKQVTQDQFLQISLPCQICLIKDNKQNYVKIFGYPRSYLATIQIRMNMEFNFAFLSMGWLGITEQHQLILLNIKYPMEQVHYLDKVDVQLLSINRLSPSILEAKDKLKFQCWETD